MNNRKPEYKTDPDEKGKFIIKNYNFARPFTSFFPGIAGPEGSPLWCFYVNRGQCITSFGTDNKDGSILEFQPANKAYAQTSVYGFRTFIKTNGTSSIIYEPFSEKQNRDQTISNEMSITPYSLHLKEVNETLKLETIIDYFALPGESLASIIRKISIKNLDSSGRSIEILDGLPVINPYGINNWILKNMSRTSEAWSYVENLENKVPFYHVKTLLDDVSKVEFEERGNFFLSFTEKSGNSVLLDPIIDPMLIFGHSPDLTYPYNFADSGFDVKAIQHFENRSTSAMAHGIFDIAPGECCNFTSLFGHAPDIDSLNSFTSTRCTNEYIDNKYIENKNMIIQLMDTLLVKSGSINFDNYTGQTFLDNLLRGGFPISLQHDDKRDVLYLYSRKHGDPERDYNDFLIKGSYLSYGNGNFRDITQNRRCDLWYNTDVGSSNIKYFGNLLQLDGHNPLVVQGHLYHFRQNSINLKEFLRPAIAEELESLLERPFEIHELSEFYRIHSPNIDQDITNFAEIILLNCQKEELAHHHEGFWVDHWFYITDLLENYYAIYPEKFIELLLLQKDFSFYDNPNFVLSRDKKYINDDDSLRQYNSVSFDKKKMTEIESRKSYKFRVRAKNGKGDIYYTTLFTKLFTLILNKLSSLDAHGVGIEMDSDKPGWNDSLNGLPGIFGSSTCETQQLYRLINFTLSILNNYEAENYKVHLPVEIYNFYKNLIVILQSYNTEKIDDHKYWELASSAKEDYRKETHYGISGKEKTIESENINEFLVLAKEKLKLAIDKAYSHDRGLYNTYYINEPVKFSGIKIDKFSQRPLPLFLEGQMHALQNENDIDKCRNLYDAVKSSDLYDKKLQMYKVNQSLEESSYEIGRARTFTPGWLENESIFLHMHYKFLLALLRCGLHDKFLEEIRNGLVPFLDPNVYGRSIFENSSFIASSANPDDSIHGTGFISRLSGSTAEFIHILLYMSLGPCPFKLDKENNIIFSPEPVLPGWLFTREKKSFSRFHNGKTQEFEIPDGSFAIIFLGQTLIVYRNKSFKNTIGKDRVTIKKIILHDKSDDITEIQGPVLGLPYSINLREGKYNRVDLELE